MSLRLSSMREQIEKCPHASLLFLQVHSGSDTWTLDEAEEFYLRVAEMEAEMDFTISHETHRSRYFGKPWNTVRLLDRVPGVKLTRDFSHLVCVAARLLRDADELFARAARNGHNCMRASDMRKVHKFPIRERQSGQHLLVHERWWESIWHTRSRWA